MMSYIIRIFFCGCVLLSCGSYADEIPLLIPLKGYLDQRQLSPRLDEIKKLQQSATLAIELSSFGGNLNELLTFSSELFEIKEKLTIKVIVYIEGEAIGPAAILPLLADELYVSPVVSWGAIPLGNEEVLPSNVLRSRIQGLIPPTSEKLRTLAIAMSDPNASIESSVFIKRPAETLVVDKFQLLNSGIAAQALTLKEFRAHLGLEAQRNDVSSIPVVEHEEQIHYNSTGINKIGYIAIDARDEEINQATWLYVKKALEYYREHKPIFIILKLDTPGGQVFAAQQISDALREMDVKYNIPIVAYIDNWAMSAGAMLAYSCRWIVAADSAGMGAAEPVIASTSGEMKEASEKVNSAIRTDFANRARFFGRNGDIAEAMVDKDILLVWRHGQVVRLENNDQIQLRGSDPDIIISPKGKLLTLNAEQLIRYGVAQFITPPAVHAISATELQSGEWPASKTPLWQLPFFKKISNATIDAYRMDWKTHFFVFLANPVVASALFSIMLIAFYIELNHPGFGIPGTAALTCFCLLALSSFSLEIANSLELIFLGLGVGFIALELFLLPTGGILGIIGAFFFIAGFFGMLLPGADQVSFEWQSSTFNAAGEAFIERLAWLCGGLVVAFAIMALLTRYITPQLYVRNRLVLKGGEQDASAGYTAAGLATPVSLIGKRAKVVSALRPTGKVEVEGVVYQAISLGEFIGEDSIVVITATEGMTLVVCL